MYVPVEKRDSATLTAVIRRYVASGSVIYTDEWRGYRKISDFYDHKTVNHSLGFVNAENSVHTNTIEGNWTHLKNFIPRRWRTSEKIWLPLAIAMAKRNGTVEEFIINLMDYQ